MSNKVKATIAIAALIAAGLVKVSLPAANASTTACGNACTSPSVESSGEVLTETGSSSVGLAAASTTSTAQDWTPLSYGPIGGAVSAGVISSKWLWQYSAGLVFEFEYAPGGVSSDLCLASGMGSGQSTTGIYNGYTLQASTTSVTLAQCGFNAQTLWITDPNNQGSYDDLISAGYEASDDDNQPSSILNGYNAHTYFGVPFVLTANGSKLSLAPLSEVGSAVSTTQMWTAWQTESEALKNAKKAS